MAFTDAEKTDIRRYCGYPVYGNTPSPFFWARYTVQYGNLEFKLNNLSPAEEAVVRTVYLAQLGPLEAAIPGASANLDTAEAAVWTWNTNETRDRAALLDLWRRRLCAFLGTAPGPGLGDETSGVRIMV